ncbi:hypothetical protein VNO80_08139 [Phaseolus coccineus]|uniref:Uncharacterized protein n=1 Tax=Phaseolus coccineus TaxID=3886 RepID=A0AAN9RKH3_PHACN
MTKFQSSVLIVLALFALFSQTYGEIKFCPKDMVFDGQCPLGTSGMSCFREFLARLGASAMPMNCSCNNVAGNKRKCTCNVVCSETNLLTNIMDLVCYEWGYVENGDGINGDLLGGLSNWNKRGKEEMVIGFLVSELKLESVLFLLELHEANIYFVAVTLSANQRLLF